MAGDGFCFTRMALFADVSAETLRRLAVSARQRSLPRGGIVAAEDVSCRIFLVLKGSVKMVRPSAGGDEALQQRLFPGDVFCLVSMVSGGHLCSYGEGLEASRLLSWPHELILELMDQDRQLCANVLLLLARQLEEERIKRCLAQCSNVASRIASFLLYRSKSESPSSQAPANDQIDLRPISLSAQELGIARETMSRTFSTLERQGVISCYRGLIKICDHERLRLIADGEQKEE
nr:Crp/Fnr family transcriptional regulator [uncultured Desulfuromonas sp.]